MDKYVTWALESLSNGVSLEELNEEMGRKTELSDSDRDLVIAEANKFLVEKETKDGR